MTIEKATTMHNKTNLILKVSEQSSIKSLCQKVLDLLDLTFADFVELHGTLGNSDSP